MSSLILIRRAVAAARSLNAAVAVWRLPDAASPDLLISLPGGWSKGAVDFADHRPAFAFSRYDNFDGKATDLIRADLLIRDGRTVFIGTDGTGHDAPVTASQTDFAALLAKTGDGDQRVTAGGSPAKPPVIVDRAHYEGLVEKTLAAIGRGEIEKAVGSRAVAVDLPGDGDLLDLFDKLRVKYPAAFVCLTLLPGVGCWVVATPERLLSVDGQGARTMALAGTQTLDAAADTEAVSWRGKFIEEQALVCRYMRTRFESCGFHNYHEAGPRTVRAANLAHLRSVFTVPADTGDFADDRAFRTACNDLLREMHPTSAVCGMPRQQAIDFLAAEEGYERDYYCGYLGPLNIAGSSDLFVNLRAAQIIGRTVYLYVGAGLVDGSVPAEEWQETVEKSKTLGSVIGG
ncbi:MAG: chorismate-binding protein [Rhodospirillales bacterium]